jgi:hypothetical protein
MKEKNLADQKREDKIEEEKSLKRKYFLKIINNI